MTVTVLVKPASSLVGKPVTVNILAAAACTAIADSVALRPGVAVSLAVIDWVPDVSSVTAKPCEPPSAALNV